MTSPGWAWRAPSTSGNSPAVPPLRPFAWPTPRASSPRNTSSSRQEWMEKNPLVYTLQSARWKRSLGQRPPLAPAALGEGVAPRPFARLRTIWRGTPWSRPSWPPSKSTCSLTAQCGGKSRCALSFRRALGPAAHQSSCPWRSSGRMSWSWAAPPSAGRGTAWSSAARALRAAPPLQRAGGGRPGLHRAAASAAASIRSRDLALIEQRCCTGDHLDCRLWYHPRCAPPPDKPHK